jgi:hypothetical protein
MHFLAGGKGGPPSTSFNTSSAFAVISARFFAMYLLRPSNRRREKKVTTSASHIVPDSGSRIIDQQCHLGAARTYENILNGAGTRDGPSTRTSARAARHSLRSSPPRTVASSPVNHHQKHMVNSRRCATNLYDEAPPRAHARAAPAGYMQTQPNTTNRVGAPGTRFPSRPGSAVSRTAPIHLPP